MTRNFFTFWKLIKIILLSHGLLNDFFSYDSVEKEIKNKKHSLNLSDTNLNLYVLSVHIVINFFYFWIITLISISDVFYEFMDESFYLYQIRESSDFKFSKIPFKTLKEIISRWYTPKYEGMILNLIINNNYVLPSA